jgi:hypothetical protein
MLPQGGSAGNAKKKVAASSILRHWQASQHPVFVMYTIAFVDRTNVCLASPAMARDLHMDPSRPGAASGIFFVGYVLLQIPGYLVCSRAGMAGRHPILCLLAKAPQAW